MNFFKFHICDTLRNFIQFAPFKNVENNHAGLLLLVKLQGEACNFTKSSTRQMNVILLTYQKQRFLFQRYTI